MFIKLKYTKNLSEFYALAFDGLYEWMLFTVRLILAECRYPFKAIRMNLKARRAGTSISHEALASMKDGAGGCKSARSALAMRHRFFSFIFFYFIFSSRSRFHRSLGDPSIDRRGAWRRV